MELIVLLLLLATNFLLLFAASRSRPDELLPWLAAHSIAVFIQGFFLIYLVIRIGMVAIPATQVTKESIVVDPLFRTAPLSFHGE